MKVIKNALNNESFLRLKSYVMNPRFSWHYIENIADKDNEQVYSPGFSFNFYDRTEDGLPDAVGYEMVFNLLATCCHEVDHNIDTILQARAFMTVPFPNATKRIPHNDLPYHHQVCLYYLTSHDEEECRTEFYDEDGNVFFAQQPEENTAVVFDGSIPHSSGYAVDSRRVIINISYLQKTPMFRG